jgi:hypothetical protein
MNKALGILCSQACSHFPEPQNLFKQTDVITPPFKNYSLVQETGGHF